MYLSKESLLTAIAKRHLNDSCKPVERVYGLVIQFSSVGSQDKFTLQTSMEGKFSVSLSLSLFPAYE